MKNIITASSLASKIWFRTALMLSLTVLFISFFVENISIFFVPAFLVGFLCSLAGSIPVLISLFILLPVFQKVNIKWQSKFYFLLFYIFFITLCYGIVAACLRIGFFDTNAFISNRFLSNLIFCTLLLFLVALTAFASCIKEAISFLTNGEVNYTNSSTFFQQLFNTPKTKKMDNQTNNENYTEGQMNNENRTAQQVNENKHSNGVLIKGIITGLLILIMLVPTFFINNLIEERKVLQEEVVKEVSSKWANAQTISAPFITVPYTGQFVNAEGKTENVKKHFIIIADKLDVKGNVFPEVRKRSIYKVLLYKSDIKFTGNFKPIVPQDIDLASADFTNAKICFALSDYKGIEEELNINFNNQKISLVQGLPIDDFGTVGVSAPITISAASLLAGINFDMQARIKGSQKLQLLPLSTSSKFSLSSRWKSPSFDGNKLPDEHTTNDSGFVAKWSFNSVNLPYAAVTKAGTMKVNETAFGVTLVQPADQYSKTTRSVKYAILLIGLSFALFFIIELLQKKPLHPVQYVLVGLALVIFYTLLLSIGEYIVFDMAYLTAALATITLITFYAKSHFDSWKSASIFASLLACLYAFVFILIRLEDAALLVGSIGLFIILALVMYGSRKINWYGK
jgi:inner membrane protein